MEKHFNRLRPDEAERLAFLSEECGEIVKIIGKIQRHGYESTNPNKPEAGTNREMLAREIADVRFAFAMLLASNDVGQKEIDYAEAQRVHGRRPHYMHHQEESMFSWIRDRWIGAR